MRFGLFCTYENPRRDYRSAYAEQTELIQLVEALGFGEVWIAEHHFNPDSASPSCLAILSYLAGRTSRIRLGSAAVLLPFRNPIQVAEDVATVDLLSEGRFDFGVAKGGPFPLQNKHFGLNKEDSREKTAEALALIQKLLHEDTVSFEGKYFSVNGVSLTPRPVQKPVPTFVATSTPDTVSMAAVQGYGIMAGPPFPLQTVRDNLLHCRHTAPGADPRLVLLRFFHIAATHEEAIGEAAKFLQPFAERMQVSTASLQPEWTPWFKLERLIEDSLIGTLDEVYEKIMQIGAQLQPHSLVLKPFAPDFEQRRAALSLFGKRIISSSP
jgi:alkanesulfonate monooxygenase SsuD/methylene tetrahydromethanopterin reductase-like flavin-dependent oxidoreductase (luciferase family)